MNSSKPNLKYEKVVMTDSTFSVVKFLNYKTIRVTHEESLLCRGVRVPFYSSV